MIPDTFKQDLLARVDVVNLVSAHVQLKKAGARFAGLCPFHDEKTPSFHVIPSKQFFHCFGCGTNGDAIGFVMLHLGMKYPEAIKYLADSVGMQLPDRPTTTADIKVIRAKMDAEAALIALEQELIIATIAVSDARNGRPLSDEDHARYLVAIECLMRTISFAKQRPLTEHEAKKLLDSALTDEEIHDIEVFVGDGPLPFGRARVQQEKQNEDVTA